MLKFDKLVKESERDLQEKEQNQSNKKEEFVSDIQIHDLDSGYILVPSKSVNLLLDKLLVLQKSIDEIHSKLGMQSNPDKTVKLLSRQTLADKFGVTLPTLDKWKNEGLIPFKRIGRRVFFNEEDVFNALKDSKRAKGVL
jgi:hypothetical protein